MGAGALAKGPLQLPLGNISRMAPTPCTREGRWADSQGVSIWHRGPLASCLMLVLLKQAEGVTVQH